MKLKRRAKINCLHWVKGSIYNANEKSFERESGFDTVFIQTVWKVLLYKSYFPNIATYEAQMVLKELYFTLELTEIKT